MHDQATLNDLVARNVIATTVDNHDWHISVFRNLCGRYLCVAPEHNAWRLLNTTVETNITFIEKHRLVADILLIDNTLEIDKHEWSKHAFMHVWIRIARLGWKKVVPLRTMFSTRALFVFFLSDGEQSPNLETVFFNQIEAISDFFEQPPDRPPEEEKDAQSRGKARLIPLSPIPYPIPLSTLE